MIRVLHCIYDDVANPWVGGGGAVRVSELYRRLAGRVDVTVATGAFPGARDTEEDGIRYRRLGVRRPYALSRLAYGAAASALLRSASYDVAVFDFSGYTPIRLPGGRPTAIVVHMLHGTTASDRWGRGGGLLVRRAERAMLRRTRDVCVTSDWLRRELAEVVAPGTRFHQVSSGVPEEFFRVARAEADWLLYYGRFDVYQKGLDVLLDAVSELHKAGDVPRLRMLGRGKDAAWLRERVAVLGLGGVVSIEENPDRPAVLAAMAGALALVHPSRFEGLPMVPAEAMAAGVPVIATDAGAVSEILDGGVAGVLIPPASPRGIVEQVRRVLDDDSFRAALSLRARTSASRFQWDRVADEHLAFLEAVAGAHRRA